MQEVYLAIASFQDTERHYRYRLETRLDVTVGHDSKKGNAAMICTYPQALVLLTYQCLVYGCLDGILKLEYCDY